MKYMLLAYTGSSDWSDVDVTSPEFLAMCEFYAHLGQELTESGELVATEGLADPTLTRTVRRTAERGGTTVSDGPFAEAKEVLASFSIVDVVDLDRALDIAARVSEATGDTIEVRPVMEGEPTADPGL